MKPGIFTIFCLIICIFSACNSGNNEKVPVIAFIDYVEDETLAQAREGFYEALEKQGYSEKLGTVKIIYRNAQGDQPALIQAVDYLLSKKPLLIASNTTLATITSVQRSHDIPVFMMVAPRPDLAGLTDASGKYPANLFGVYETLEYIDTSVNIIRNFFPEAKTVATIYNQSEPQSIDALAKLEEGCKRLGLELIRQPVSSSADTKIITEALLSKDPDVFFALPDNIVFSSFEAIINACNRKNIPVVTSESGLVMRGALASFGADMRAWGYQCGLQAAEYLRNGKRTDLKPEIVKDRSRVYNPKPAKKYNIQPGPEFKAVIVTEQIH